VDRKIKNMEKSTNKNNWPSYGEYKKVENSMTPEEKAMSEEREATYKAGANEKYPLTPKQEEWNYFEKKFPRAVDIEFRNNEGRTETKIRISTFSDSRHEEFDTVLISTEQEADEAKEEIKKSLNKSGWEKIYVCADAKLAHYIKEGIATDGYQNIGGL